MIRTTLNIEEPQVVAALGDFLSEYLADGTEIFRSQVNRVPEPSGPDFVMMTPLRSERLATNETTYIDTVFEGVITNNLLWVERVLYGRLQHGLVIVDKGNLLHPDTYIVRQFSGEPQVAAEQLEPARPAPAFVLDDQGNVLLDDEGRPLLWDSGTTLPATTRIVQTEGPLGGAGMYEVSPSQFHPPRLLDDNGDLVLDDQGNVLRADDRRMYAGQRADMAATQFTFQLDIHGPASWGNVQRVETIFRSSLGTSYFDSLGIEIAPLYCEQPRQIPFVNMESQYENRWTIDVQFQINPVVGTPMRFAEEVHPLLISVDLLREAAPFVLDDLGRMLLDDYGRPLILR